MKLGEPMVGHARERIEATMSCQVLARSGDKGLTLFKNPQYTGNVSLSVTERHGSGVNWNHVASLVFEVDLCVNDPSMLQSILMGREVPAERTELAMRLSLQHISADVTQNRVPHVACNSFRAVIPENNPAAGIRYVQPYLQVIENGLQELGIVKVQHLASLRTIGNNPESCMPQ